MKDIFVGDEHGRGKFLSIYNSVKDRNDIRYIVCLGDYFDPYGEKKYSDLIENFEKIIEIKKSDDRVKLLFGNHDNHYLIQSDGSRMIYELKENIKKVFLDNLDLFDMVLKLDSRTLVSHAGVSKQYLKRINIKDPLEINKLFHEKKFDYFVYDDMDNSGYGEAPYQGCTWIRPNGLTRSPLVGIDTQIVGHSQTTSLSYFIHVEDSNDPVVYTDDEIGKTYVFVDTGDNVNFYEREVVEE